MGVRGSFLRIPPSRTFRRQGHEANRGRRCHQVYHPQGGLRNHHKGRTKGPKEEITRCNARTWGFRNEKIRKNCNKVSSLLSLNSSDSSVRSSFQTAIKLNFYFHRKEFRRKKGQINEEKPGIS